MQKLKRKEKEKAKHLKIIHLHGKYQRKSNKFSILFFGNSTQAEYEKVVVLIIEMVKQFD